MNDRKFYMLESVFGDDLKKINRIIKVKMHFTLYNIDIVFEEVESQELIEFGLDDVQNKLILLSKPRYMKINEKNEERIFKIFDLF